MTKVLFTTIRNTQNDVVGFFHKSDDKYIEIFKNFDKTWTTEVGHMNSDGTMHKMHKMSNRNPSYCKRWGAKVMGVKVE